MAWVSQGQGAAGGGAGGGKVVLFGATGFTGGLVAIASEAGLRERTPV